MTVYTDLWCDLAVESLPETQSSSQTKKKTELMLQRNQGETLSHM